MNSIESKKQYRIEVSAEDGAETTVLLSNTEAKLVKRIFDDLRKSSDEGFYAPLFFMYGDDGKDILDPIEDEE